MTNYAFIKDDKVVNIAVFDNPSNELLNNFKIEHGVDEIVLCDNNPNAVIGGDYDGIDFISLSPFPSWVLVDKTWQAPKPKPDDVNDFHWDENMVDWVAMPMPMPILTEEPNVTQEENQVL